MLLAALVGGGVYAGTRGGDEAAPVTTVAAITTTTVAETTTTAFVPRTVAELATSTVMVILTDDDGNGLCSGSGTIVESDGTILTNAHVVARDDFCPYSKIIIAITDDSGVPPVPAFEADLLAVDPELDLAVVRAVRNLDGSPVSESFVATAIGDSDAVLIGDDIRILGYPGIGGETITFTNGSVAGFTAQAGVGDRSWIKTDATIAGGNSGGTAVNDEGELIGIPTQGGASSESPIVDCRVITDTNGDGVVNGSDQCVPFGGFLNGIRPVNLARPLLEEAKTASPITFAPAPTQSVDVSNLYFYLPAFSRSVADVEENTDFIVTANSTDTELCFWINWANMVPGAQWDAIWIVNDEVSDKYSFFNQPWEGEADGTDFWVCATEEAGFVPGLYEIAFLVEGEIAFIEAIEVTAAPVPVHTVTFVNSTDVEVCFLAVNPLGSSDVGLDELGTEETLFPGDSKDLFLPEGTMIAEAYDCDSNPVSSALDGLAVSEDTVVTMTAN
ncbi:MAG: S1-C subfamily serine protease [Acidimicrobiales bacterium]